MDFKGFVNFLISTLITPLFSLFLAAAVVFFLWNIMGVIKKGDQPEELAKMKEKAIWGVIAIAVMVSMWGLVNFFTGTFQLNNTPLNLDRFNQAL
jgi:FtsH-binding integral membrane protein